MARFHAQSLLTLALCVIISGGRADSSVSKAVNAAKEENVALPCSVSNLTDLNSYRIRWIKDASDPRKRKVILVRPKTPKIQDAARVRWEADEEGKMSLFLTELEESDGGIYSCEICTGWDCEILSNTSLRVKQCKVLPERKVPPSTPVNLTCPVDVTQTPQNILWQKLKGDDTETLPNGTSLTIQSVRSSDSGWYRCKVMLGKTQRCFEFNLQVENVAVTTSKPALETKAIKRCKIIRMKNSGTETDVFLAMSCRRDMENVAGTTSVPALTISAVSVETRNEGRFGALIPVIVSVIIIGIAVTAAVALLIVYNRRNNQRALRPTRQTQRPTTGPARESIVPYEIVDFTPSNDLLNRVNSFYQDESMCSFHYN